MGDDEFAAPRARVRGLFIYPVKSCRGIAVERATIGPRGFRWDREWMLVDGRGRMQTQRAEPRLALVETALPAEALNEGDWGAKLPADTALHLSAPGMEPLQVPLTPAGPRPVVDQVSVWKWGGSALDEGPVPAAWFSRYLQKPVRLVRFRSATEVWPTDPAYAPPGFHISFTDGYPFMVATAASLRALNDALLPGGTPPLPIDRFRPNLVLDGAGLRAFEEDLWHTFRVGGCTFQGVKPRARCKITTTDQRTAEVGREPLQVLRTFRAGQILAPAKPEMRNEVFFAMNAVCLESLDAPGSRPPAVVQLGHPLQVVQWHPEIGARVLAPAI